MNKDISSTDDWRRHLLAHDQNALHGLEQALANMREHGAGRINIAITEDSLVRIISALHASVERRKKGLAL
jgi:DNA-binding TFAR19-related protein (PDSD5 family)